MSKFFMINFPTESGLILLDASKVTQAMKDFNLEAVIPVFPSEEMANKFIAVAQMVGAVITPVYTGEGEGRDLLN